MRDARRYDVDDRCGGAAHHSCTMCFVSARCVREVNGYMNSLPDREELFCVASN